MPGVIQIERSFEIPFPRREVWPVLNKTDWINRALGLPSVNYDVKPLKEGGSAVTARAKVLGFVLSWQELPFEWVEPEFYRVRRIFEKGPFSEARVGLDFSDGSPGGTHILVYSHFTARNAFGAWFARNILGPKTNRSMRLIMDHVTEYLRGKKRIAIPKLPRKPVAVHALQAGLKKLRETVPDPALSGKMEALLRESADVELSHIRPFAVARTWQWDRWEVLRLFLHATRAGLLDFRWEVLCPNCRSSREEPEPTLASLQKTAHCDVCQIKFDGEFDRSVELKFAVNRAVRPRDNQTYCLAGPGGKPHVVSQLLLQPGQRLSWKWPDPSRSYRLRSPQIKEPLTLPSPERRDPEAEAVVECRSERFEMRPVENQSGDGSLQFFNPNPFAVQLIFENTEWDDDILTAAQATNWQEFRDLFHVEVISPNEQVTVGSQIVLFTDLRGSTALYNGVGDAPAYVMVRNHFVILSDIIRDHHGAIVKTIGDAVMAVFSQVDEALAAVKQMHEKLPAANADKEEARNLKLKSSLHIGPCLAVNANDKLDFFGTAINLAARMVDRCQGDDLTVSDDLYQRPETTEFLKAIGKSAEPSEVKFRGFETAHKIWRIPIL
jgi:adenylate cyclase